MQLALRWPGWSWFHRKLIFGNRQLGTSAMRDDALAGLYLPLRVLVYRGGDGQG